MKKSLRTTCAQAGLKVTGILIMLLAFFMEGTLAQTTINPGITTNASAVSTGNTVTIMAGGTLNMNVARTFASITMSGSGTSTITGSSLLTVSGTITLAANNTLSLNTSCNAGELITTDLKDEVTGISGTGTITLQNDLVINDHNGNHDATLNIGSGITISCASVSTNGSIGTSLLNLSGNLKLTGSISTDVFTCNSGSTVEYMGAAQNIFPVNYYNLILSGSGQKTMDATTAIINGNFSLSGTASATAATALTIGGNVLLESGTSFTAGNYTHTVAGNWTNNGASFTAGTGTISLNGVTQTIGGTTITTFKNLVTNGNGVKSLGESTVVNGSLNLNSTAPISIGAHTLTISGVITGGGKISGSSSSSLVIAGTAGILNFDQTSAATRSLKDMTFSSGSSATLGSALEVYGVISLTSATFHVAGQNLTLKSNASGTASVGNLSGSALDGATNVTVERYIANTGHRSWHLLSSKAVASTQTIYQSWQENGATGTSLPGYGTIITSNYYTVSNGFDASSNTSSILTCTQGPTGPSWNYTLANTNSILLTANSAYMLYVRGDRNYYGATPGYGATVLRSKGTLTQGNQAAITVSSTGGFRTLVANPYASAIDFENIHSTANLDQNFYVWDAALTGSYGLGAYRLVERNANGTYQQTPVAAEDPSADAKSRYIHSGQAFFLRATGSNASVVFTENAKAGSVSIINPFSNPVLNKTIINPPIPAAADQQVFVNLMVASMGTASILADGLRVRFNNAYSTQVTDEDIEKTGNMNENLSSYRDGKKLIVEKRPLGATDTIFLQMSGVGIRKYSLQIGTIDFTQAGVTAYLHDNFLGSNTTISLTGGLTNIDFSITADAGSYAADRFYIVFGGKRRTIDIKSPGSNNGNVNATDLNPAGINTNVAAVSSATNKNIITTPAVVSTETAVTASVKTISVYPNPVVNHMMNIYMAQMEKGNYSFRLFNSMGQVAFSRMIMNDGGKGTQAINLGSAVVAGTYTMVVTTPVNERIVQRVVVLQ